MGQYSYFIPDGDDGDRYPTRRSNNNYSMITRNNKIPDIYEGEDDEPEDKPQWCPHCLKFDMKNKLGARIVPYGEEAQPDHELWQSCYVCGKTFPKREAKYEQAIEGFAEVTDNPMDDVKGHVESIPKRTSPAGQKALAKRRRERDRPHHKDKEIDEEMRKHGDRVTVLEDTDP